MHGYVARSGFIITSSGATYGERNVVNTGIIVRVRRWSTNAACGIIAKIPCTIGVITCGSIGERYCQWRFTGGWRCTELRADRRVDGDVIWFGLYVAA